MSSIWKPHGIPGFFLLSFLSLFSVVALQGIEIETTLEVIDEVPYSAEGMVFIQLDGHYLAVGGLEDGEWKYGGMIYNPADSEWEPYELPFTVRNAAYTSEKETAWIVGGYDEEGVSRAGWRLSLNDEGKPGGSPLPVLPMAVYDPSIIPFENYLYLAGHSAPEIKEDSRNILLRLDRGAEDPSWEKLSPWSEEPLLSPFFGVQNSELYLSGDFGDVRPSPMYRLQDSRDPEWDERMSAPFTLHPVNGVPAGHSNIIYLVDNPDFTDKEVSHLAVAYNVITDRWARVGPIRGNFDAVYLENIQMKNALMGVSYGGTGILAEMSVGMAARPFGPVDYSIIFIYIIGLVLMGFYFSRKEDGTDDYFVGGRKVPWWAVGLSLYATGTSAISFMAISGRTYSSNWLYFTHVFFGLLLAAVIALFLVPLIRKLNVTSTYEYLEYRFHVSVRLLGSFILIMTQLGSRMSVVLFLPALALSKVTGISVVESVIAMGIIATLYTYLGGIKAVIWTDVVQVIILLGGAFFCLGYVVVHVDGGFVGFIETAGNYEKLQVFDWRLTLETATIWVFFLASVAGIMTIPNDQVMMQRVLSTRNERAATNSIWTLTLMTIPGNLVFFALGTALWVFYANFPDRLDPSLQFDATFPHFVAHEFPVGLAGLVISALFAASMSTLDSGMNSVSTVISVDFYKRFKKSATDGQVLRLARIITILAGILSTGMALVLTRYSLPSLWDTMILLTGLIGGGFGGVFALGMFTRRANTIGAITGVIASLIAALLVRTYGNVHVFMVMPTAVFTVVIVGYAVSLMTPSDNKDLRGLTLFKVDRVPREEREAKLGRS